MASLKMPRDAVLDVLRSPVVWPGADERFAGYGVMGLPFTSGHYLALRHMAASSIGPAHRTVWHCAPDGEWKFISDAAPEQSCARYFASATPARTGHSPVEITWDGPCSLRVTVPQILEWRMELASTPATALMSALGNRLPTVLWRSDVFRRVLGLAARPLLRAGRIGLAGRASNGQRFAAAPRLVWRISSSSAVLHGVDLGSPHPLRRQLRLGDFALPQRGLFAVANAAFETLDPSRHRVLTPAEPQPNS